ncbi:MAG TPA: hypothetical protein DEP25_03050 [Candidatus Taylorbacteria bacterium]|nr:MAG: FAD synthase [Parcubacteria group bacterium GW2011_GWF2_50_9]HCB35593.1 hypothetical protein [Candidatus Taylorbacteria bacterium]
MEHMVLSRKQSVVLVFGVFDGLHNGHRFLLGEARKLGNRLIAAVAQDSVVAQIKRRPPVHSLAERIKMLEESRLVDHAVPGDTTLGSWSAVMKWKPNIVALGYDQTELEKELRTFIKKENLPLAIVKIEAHEGNRLHSRFLRTS